MVGNAIGAVASVGGALISSSAAGDAADQQSAAANSANATQLQMYNQTRQDQLPFLNTGTAANKELSYLLGLPSSSSSSTGAPGGFKKITGQEYSQITGGKGGIPGAYNVPNPNSTPEQGDDIYVPVGSVPSGFQSKYDTAASTGAEGYTGVNTGDGAFGSLAKPFGMSDFTEDPGYQFRLSEGQKALDRSAAAKGGLLSGAAVKAAANYGQNVASDEFNQAYNRYNTNQTNLFNRLSGLSGGAQTSANTLATTGVNTANQIANNTTSAGAAQAAGTVGAANGWLTGLNNLTSSFGSSGSSSANPISSFDPGAYASGLPWSDIRLKENIIPKGYLNGWPVYEFNYWNSAKRYLGVMAQEIQKMLPQAVHEREGFLCVDYNLLGIEFREVKHGA